MQFIEGSEERDTNSDGEGVELVADMKEKNIIDDDSLQLEQVISTL